ncbi:hypothetical protein DL89DRAFT_10411 [Linderina pennispora]|uniref:Uncharacterized protein n=1 Tax=Linderina pennispora TaxID=61395 RepID=A0A1Y1WKY6_9FUNG|nr:uncharacterized protein DL89DRAFT_10411 [Linderina pennispora]ORX74143.1 hypothetical protein DL89DRAFT_10411 [Linderina pennispora]
MGARPDQSDRASPSYDVGRDDESVVSVEIIDISSDTDNAEEVLKPAAPRPAATTPKPAATPRPVSPPRRAAPTDHSSPAYYAPSKPRTPPVSSRPSSSRTHKVSSPPQTQPPPKRQEKVFMESAAAKSTRPPTSSPPSTYMRSSPVVDASGNPRPSPRHVSAAVSSVAQPHPARLRALAGDHATHHQRSAAVTQTKADGESILAAARSKLRPAKKREDPSPESWEFVERPQQQEPAKPGFIESAIKKSTNALKGTPQEEQQDAALPPRYRPAVP